MYWQVVFRNLNVHFIEIHFNLYSPYKAGQTYANRTILSTYLVNSRHHSATCQQTRTGLKENGVAIQKALPNICEALG